VARGILLACIWTLLLGMTGDKKCGTWRWNVKTLTDTEGMKVLTTEPVSSTIDILAAEQEPVIMHRKSLVTGDFRRLPGEDHRVTVVAEVVKMKRENDRDFHLVLRSPATGETLVGEIPDPECACFRDFPELQRIFRQTRQEGEIVWNKLKKKKKPVRVLITGVPFWDFDHDAGTKKGRFRHEIHPITRIVMQRSSDIPNK